LFDASNDCGAAGSGICFTQTTIFIGSQGRSVR